MSEGTYLNPLYTNEIQVAMRMVVNMEWDTLYTYIAYFITAKDWDGVAQILLVLYMSQFDGVESLRFVLDRIPSENIEQVCLCSFRFACASGPTGNAIWFMDEAVKRGFSDITAGFTSACSNDNLKMVECMLEKYKFSSTALNKGFATACELNGINTVKYLLANYIC